MQIFQMPPTTTTNRLHFDDLDFRRFEDLCHAMVFPLREWLEMSHFGRSGSDGGIDINAIEQTEDGLQRQWAIQCKRYKSITPQEAKNAVDAAIKGDSPPDVFLLAVACDVSRTTVDALKAHSAERGIKETLIWDASYLESTLYNDRKDLLFTYFGIDIQIGRTRFEISDFSASIEEAQDPDSCVVIIDPYAPEVGDLDMSLDGAFFHDDDGSTGLSKFSFVFRAPPSDEKQESVTIKATAVTAFPEGPKAAADYSGRVNLPSRKYIGVHLRGSVARAELPLLEKCRSVFLSASVGSKKRKRWKIAEKRNGEWQKM